MGSQERVVSGVSWGAGDIPVDTVYSLTQQWWIPRSCLVTMTAVGVGRMTGRVPPTETWQESGYLRPLLAPAFPGKREV